MNAAQFVVMRFVERFNSAKMFRMGLLLSVSVFIIYEIANNNKVVNNTIKATNGDTGISVGAVDESVTYTPSSDNNKVNSKTISGYTTPIDTSVV